MDSRILTEHDALDVAIIYSPYESAQIVSISKEEALKIEGVHSVITAEDIPGENNILGTYGKCRLFAEGEVEYKGQILAAVLAENLEIAKEAMSFVFVEYKPLPPVIGIEEAVNFNNEHENLKEYELIDKEVSSDDLKYVEINHSVPEYNSEKGQLSVVVEPDIGGGVTIYTNNIDSKIYASSLEALLSLESDKIIFKSSYDTSSCVPFDLIDLSICGLASVCALYSKKKVVIPSDYSQGAAKRLRHGEIRMVSTVGYESDCKIRSVKLRMKLDCGSQSGTSSELWLGFLNVINQLNHCSIFDLICDRCKTNEVPNGSNVYDGAWIGLLVLEEAYRQIALESSKRLSKVRRNNLPVDDSLEKLEAIYNERKESVKKANGLDEGLKRGVYLIYLTTSNQRDSQINGDNLTGAALTEVELDSHNKSIRLIYSNITQQIDLSVSKSTQKASAVASFISGVGKISGFDNNKLGDSIKEASLTQIFPNELFCSIIPGKNSSLMIPYCLSLSVYFAICNAIEEFDGEF
ncbi:MAG: hypothetical protein CMO46_07560 [Verrucomicrobiales bacterium]|nr:hypothetical protein [Verrucomicrobiales bacterium]